MQAMLNVDDMFMLSQNKVASIFIEYDVNTIPWSEREKHLDLLRA